MLVFPFDAHGDERRSSLGFLAFAKQMLAQAIRRLLNAHPHCKKRGAWIE
jgi:hypothetical protein